MHVRRLDIRDYKRQRWKNDGGSTTELAIHGDRAHWLWRLSIAEVERSGDFSDFSGYERTTMLLEGNGMELMFDDGASQRIDRRHGPNRNRSSS